MNTEPPRTIWITGFPRSGTSYLHRALLAHPWCYGPPDESPAPLLWEMRRALPSRADVDAMVERARAVHMPPDVHLSWHAGVYIWWQMQTHPRETIDGLSMAYHRTRPSDRGPRVLVLKTPMQRWPQGWPEEYDPTAETLVCYRPAADTYASMKRHFTAYDEPFSEFETRHSEYYAKRRSRAAFVLHEELARNTDRELGWLADHLHLPGLRAIEPFHVTTLGEASP